MAVYWISFRIAQEKTEKGTGDERRKALYDAIESLQSKKWEIPTSFIMFESEKSIGTIANLLKKCVTPDSDKIILRKIDGGYVYFIGNKEDFDALKKIHSNSIHH